MIKDGQIVYGRSEHLLSALERRDPIVYAFVLAVFSTVLSYQVSTVLTDLLLGLKRNGEARLSDVGSILLAQEGSCVAVIRNLIRSDVASQFYVNRPERGADQHGKIGASAVGKLLVLLAVAPVVNLAAIAVTIERNHDLSLADAGFGGMALGINNDLSSLKFVNRVGKCFEFPVELANQDAQVMRFFLCTDPQYDSNDASSVLLNSSRAKDVTLEIKRTAAGVLSVSACFLRATISFHSFINIRVERKVYRLLDSLTLDEAKLFMNRAEEIVMKDICVSSFNPVRGEEKLNRTGRCFALSRTFSQCADPSSFESLHKMPGPQFFKSMFVLLEPVTIVNSDKALVAQEVALGTRAMNENAFSPADDLPAIKRRGSLINGGWLAICAALSIVVRVVVRFVTNNDTKDGIEILVKEELGLPRYDSMLQSTKKVDYRCSKSGHIGLKEVEDVQETGEKENA